MWCVQDEHILARKYVDRWMARALGVGLFKRRLYRKEVEDTRQVLLATINPLAKVSACSDSLYNSFGEVHAWHFQPPDSFWTPEPKIKKCSCCCAATPFVLLLQSLHNVCLCFLLPAVLDACFAWFVCHSVVVSVLCSHQE